MRLSQPVRSPLLCSLVWLIVCGLLVGVSDRARAHDALDKQIADLTRQITKKPGDPRLYLRRGELYRQTHNWRAALTDYQMVELLDPSSSSDNSKLCLSYCRGLVFLESGRPEKARPLLDRFLTRQPKHYGALLARGRVLALLKQPQAAYENFTRALALDPLPEPDLYIERARLAACPAAEVAFQEQCLAGLEEGLRKRGALITLELCALDLERSLKRYEATLARLDRIAAHWPRQDNWMAQRGELLLQAGRSDEGLRAYEEAAKTLAGLPARTRNLRATADLERQVLTTITRLKISHNPASPSSEGAKTQKERAGEKPE